MTSKHLVCHNLKLSHSSWTGCKPRMDESGPFLNMVYQKEGPSVTFSKDKPLEEQPDQSQSYQLPHSLSCPASFKDLSASSSSRIFAPTNLVKTSPSDLRRKPQFSGKVEPYVNIPEADTKHRLKQTQTMIPANEKNGQQTPPYADLMSASKRRNTSLLTGKEDQCSERYEASHEFRSKFNQTMHDEKERKKERRRQSWTPGERGSPAYQGTPGREDADLKCQRTAEVDVCDALLRRRRWSSFVSLEQWRSGGDNHLGIHTYSDMKKVVVLPNGSRAEQHPQSGGTVPNILFQIHWLFPVGLVAYVLSTIPIAAYVTGVSVGVACGFILGSVLAFVLAVRCSSSASKSGYIKPRKRDPPDVKHVHPETLEGWLKQTLSYNPETFHQSATHPVFASLAGTQLRLSHPQASDGPTQEITHLPSCTYQLANCQVSLAPPGLARKRVWNKKYPICITLAEGEVGEENVPEEQEGEGSKRNHATSEHNMPPVILYLFACTGREKEEWFENFRSASASGVASGVNTESTEEHSKLPEATRARKSLDYTAYMTQLAGSESRGPAQDTVGDKGSPGSQKKVYAEAARAELVAANEAEAQTAWLNSLLGRIFWSFLQDQYWTDVVACKIQQKLLKFKLKYLMSELALVDLDIGTRFPQILNISKPTLDHRGLWLDLELMYTGSFQMTLQTKMNLSKMGKDDQDKDQCISEAQRERLSKLVGSDEESSSAASSEDEDFLPTTPRESGGDTRAMGAADMNSAGSTSTKILKFMDKITKSKYFQKARENEYIWKKIAEVTNMSLMLTVEVLELSGTLAINIPPPPSDRIWYSFRAPPKLDLSVRPMLGEREVTFTQITEWIEKKLKGEFQKWFVMPNMDDLFVPLMTCGPSRPFATCEDTRHHRPSPMEAYEREIRMPTGGRDLNESSDYY
ncbi:testis-expressed protein 2-like isoform X2 [Vanacampus margaritifer]